MFDNSRGEANNPIKLWAKRHPRLALGMLSGAGAATVLLFLASAHRSGLPMITPGKKPSLIDPASMLGLLAAAQAPFARDQTKAATRHAEAKA